MIEIINYQIFFSRNRVVFLSNLLVHFYTTNVEMYKGTGNMYRKEEL